MSRVRAHAVAVAAVAGATALTVLLRPVIEGAVSTLFLAAVVVACWAGGRGPGLLATALSLGVIEALFYPPFLSFDGGSLVRAVTFAVVALLAASLYGRAQSARESAEALARAREELLRQEQSARADAETAGRAKDEFLSSLSHELRTPLNALMGWVWWLRRGGLDEDKQERALVTIERNTNALAQLIEDLLDVSRIITGKLRLAVRPTEPAPVVSAAVDALRPAAAAKSIAIVLDLEEKTGPILVDSDRLQQILWNLVSNAIKFTPDHGRVDVMLRRADGEVILQVRDSGQGIPADLLPRVFERFRQGDALRPGAGLGLGLAIVRHLVEVHGGRITAESAGEGRGATFTVILPVSAPATARAAAVETAPSTRGPRLDDIRVLVVEDDVDSRLWVKESLESLGAVALIATSAQEGFETFEHERPHVLVSDIRLPDGDGYTLLRRIREADAARGTHTPAVALTAYPRVEDRARALEAGFQLHVPKPVAPEDLAAAIASLAGRGGA
ncbi:MAG TPA: ATP-binding protein [Methylomirabilota bacterium]|nr:ATP-binding protein [Methylomirabilota bacterium]